LAFMIFGKHAHPILPSISLGCLLMQLDLTWCSIS